MGPGVGLGSSCFCSFLLALLPFLLRFCLCLCCSSVVVGPVCCVARFPFSSSLVAVLLCGLCCLSVLGVRGGFFSFF